MDAQTPHPFAKFVAILGRGKTKQRHLTQDESREAMEMILRGDVLPEQLGAFLMLLRLKEEAPEEIAGFAEATKHLYDLPQDIPHVDLDWSSYAGKRIQLPYFILSVMALVNAGYKVTMHGTEGHTPGRVYTRGIIKMLGLPEAANLHEAADQIRSTGFSYIPLEVLSPRLRELIELRPIFGLRSPVHTFSRMLNPLNAETMMQGIFHRGFMDIHAGAAKLMGQPRMAVFRGEGGEIERRPNKPTPVWSLLGDGEPIEETWPQMLENGHQPPDENMDVSQLVEIWQGKSDDTYALTSVTGTLAITLRTMGKAADMASAEATATELWNSRDKGFLPRA